MFEQFSDLTLPLHEGLLNPKESQFNKKKKQFFVNATISLMYK